MSSLLPVTALHDVLLATTSTPGTDFAVPPVEMHANQAAGWAIVILALANLPLCVFYAIRISRREGHFVVPALMLGGVAFAFLEPIFDIVGGVWYPPDIPLPAATIFGRTVNWGVVAAYVFFFWATSYGVYAMMRRGKPLRDLFLFAAAFALLDSVLEMGAAKLDIFVWYTRQGEPVAAVFGLPIHMIVWNGAYAIFSGGLLFLAMPYLKKGAQALLVVPGVTIAYGVASSLLAAPSVWALNNEVSPAVSWICGLISCVAMLAATLYVATLPPIAQLRSTSAGSSSLTPADGLVRDST